MAEGGATELNQAAYDDGIAPPPDASIGELVKETAEDLSRLMRMELALLKAETKEEAAKAGKGAGMLAGAGVAGHMLAVFASVALMWLLDHWLARSLAALVVAILWGIVAAVLYSSGRKNLKQVNPKPEQTIDSVKEDVQWVKDRKS